MESGAKSAWRPHRALADSLVSGGVFSVLVSARPTHVRWHLSQGSTQGVPVFRCCLPLETAVPHWLCAVERCLLAVKIALQFVVAREGRVDEGLHRRSAYRLTRG